MSSLVASSLTRYDPGSTPAKEKATVDPSEVTLLVARASVSPSPTRTALRSQPSGRSLLTEKEPGYFASTRESHSHTGGEAHDQGENY